MQKSNGYSCQCVSPYTGVNCQTRNDCASNPCLNKGVCIQNSNGFTCNCPSNYGGSTCAIRTDCFGSGCLNGGECILTSTSSYICQCPAGVTGPFCESVQNNACLSGPCLNSGICYTYGNSYYCLCSALTAGPNCQFINWCYRYVNIEMNFPKFSYLYNFLAHHVLMEGFVDPRVMDHTINVVV
jgi:hypothetical protein